MATHTYMILSRAAPGEEAEFERWYAEQHLADVCRMAGVVRGELLRLDGQRVYDLDAPDWTHMTIYELETDDPEALLAQIRDAAGSDAMPMSPALSKAGMVQAVGHRVAARG